MLRDNAALRENVNELKLNFVRCQNIIKHVAEKVRVRVRFLGSKTRLARLVIDNIYLGCINYKTETNCCAAHQP